MDLFVNLIVILCTLAIVALIFTVSARRRQARRRRLRAYCEERGYSYREKDERLGSAVVIQNGGWRLETGTRASERSSESGSSDVIAYTRWARDGADPAAPRAWLGTLPAAGASLLDGFLPLISLAVPDALEGLERLPLKAPLDGRFALMARPGADGLGENVERLLADWPAGWELRGTAGPDGIALTVPGRRMDAPQDLDVVIELGEALTARFSSI